MSAKQATTNENLLVVMQELMRMTSDGFAQPMPDLMSTGKYWPNIAVNLSLFIQTFKN